MNKKNNSSPQNKEDLNQEMSGSNKPLALTNNKYFNSKILVICLIIFLVVVLPFFAFKFVLNYAKPVNTANNETYQSNNKNEIAWKTYTNNEIGISFSYPGNWNPLTKDEELCLSANGSTRDIDSKTCVGIYLSNSLENGYFFMSQSKIFPDHNPGRGGSWGDYYTLNYKNSKIAPKSFIDSLCSKRKSYSCELKNNNYNFTYVKVLDDEQVVQSKRKANYYYVLSGNDNFPILIFSNQALLDSMSLKDAEIILDKIVSSLRVTAVIPYNPTTNTPTPTPTPSVKSCIVDWSKIPRVMTAGQTYNIPVTFTSNFGTRLPSIYVAPGGWALYRANNYTFNQNYVTVTLNIKLDTEGNYLFTPYLDDASGKGVKCNPQDFDVTR